MLPELSRLIDLQEIDREMLELTRELARLPQELADLSRDIEDLDADRTARELVLDDLARQRRETEAEMADLEAAIKASRSRLMEIKKDLEYQARLKEIAFQEDQRDQKEIRIIQILDEMEEQKREVEALQERIAQEQELFRQKEGESHALIEDLQKRLAVIEAQRQAIHQDIPKTLLKRYDFIRQRHNSTTVAEVQEGVCLGCHMNILPQQFIDLQKGQDILYCPNCQRILYWVEPEENDETPDKPPQKAAKG